MKTRVWSCRAVVLLTCLACSAPRARALDSEGPRFAVGFQHIVWNAFGPSVSVDVSTKVTLQAMIGVLYTRSGERDMASRLLYRFKDTPRYHLYQYDLLGTMRLSEYTGTYSAMETGLCLGSGLGVEYPLRRGSALAFTAEGGIEAVIGFDVIDGNYVTPTGSAGISLRF